MTDKYNLLFSNQVKKDLKKISKKDKILILKYIDDNLRNTSNPFKYDLDMTKLKGHNNLYRYRIGKYRIICQIKKNELLILVLNINKRNDNTYNFK